MNYPTIVNVFGDKWFSYLFSTTFDKMENRNKFARASGGMLLWIVI